MIMATRSGAAVDLLSLERIRGRLRNGRVGTQLYLYDAVDSTDARLRALAGAGTPEGTVALAERPRTGRGQPVDLQVSVLFRPATPAPGEVGAFTFAATLALADAVKDEGVVPAIEWPGTVRVGGRTVGRVLAECAQSGEAAVHVVVGVAVTLNAVPPAAEPAGGEATSVAAECGHVIDRSEFAGAYLEHLEHRIAAWAAADLDEVLAAWLAVPTANPRTVD